MTMLGHPELNSGSRKKNMNNKNYKANKMIQKPVLTDSGILFCHDVRNLLFSRCSFIM
jgi:hypothetical protein